MCGCVCGGLSGSEHGNGGLAVAATGADTSQHHAGQAHLAGAAVAQGGQRGGAANAGDASALLRTKAPVPL